MGTIIAEGADVFDEDTGLWVGVIDRFGREQRVVDAIGSYLGAGLWSARPSSGLTVGQTYRATDIGRAPGTLFIWDGTRWRSLAGRYVLGESGTSIFVNSTTELATPSIRQLMPRGLLPAGARVTLLVTVDKGNTTTAGVLRVRFGPAGSSSDPEISAAGGFTAFPSSANASGNMWAQWRHDALTSMRAIGAGSNSGAAFKLHNHTSTAAAVAVTGLTDSGSADLYFSVNAYCSADVNTYIRDWQIAVED